MGALSVANIPIIMIRTGGVVEGCNEPVEKVLGLPQAVTDEGCGIPGADLARVLEPFHTTKAPDQGTGLGLAMVDKFCQESGGYCAISSEINMGTKVSMILPLINE